MRNFNNNNSGRSQDRRRSGGGDFGRPRHNSRNSGRSQMHDAVCSDCNNNCKVPFMPSSGKPIYCSDCFEKRGNSRGNEDNNSRRPRSSGFDNRSPKNYDKQFKTINEKLDVILKTLAPKEEENVIPDQDVVVADDETDVDQASGESQQDTPEAPEDTVEVEDK